MSSVASGLQSFNNIVSSTLRWSRRLFWSVLLVVGLLGVAEIAHLFEWLARIHPTLAWTVGVAVALPLLYWSGRRAAAYFRAPRLPQRPELPDLALGWNADDRRRFRNFAQRFAERQARNPHLPESARRTIPEVIEKIRRPLPPESAADPIVAARQLDVRVRGALSELLAPLDAEANRLIRRAAVEVSLATAVSPSVLLDALITLTRNVDLISRLTQLYQGRPGLLGTLRVARDVFGSAVAAGALEAVSDNVSGALAEMTGSFGTRVLGPIGQGVVNGLVTLRIGAAARRRSRGLDGRKVPFVPWRLADYRRATSSLLGWLRQDAGPAVTRPFANWLEWVGDAAKATVKGGVDQARTARSRWFGWRKRKASPAGSAAGVAPRQDDPVLDSGLLD